MGIFGIIMILAVVQLFVVGSIIQRGNASLIPGFLLTKVTNLPAYCRMFGNRLILLALIGIVCAVMSFTSAEFNSRPIIIFGLGIVLVIVLLILDHKKFTK
ncbi:hypothetical protein [Emergencia sp.]|uniref:hypothetical protein n=1 Tax=Emergencia sp. TaxID=1926557 RepID=UPI003AF0CA2D